MKDAAESCCRVRFASVPEFACRYFREPRSISMAVTQTWDLMSTKHEGCPLHHFCQERFVIGQYPLAPQTELISSLSLSLTLMSLERFRTR